MKKTALLFAYPWDLRDEGIERALDFIAGRAGFNSLCLALSYHIATYFLPHNPRRKLYYGEHGALYFHPRRERYERTKIRPPVSRLAEGDDAVFRIREEAKVRGLEFAAWIVYLYDHHLARTYPDCAKVDAFGNPYLSMLCPANPHVREYAFALTRDIMEQFDPDAVNLESLSYLPFEYGFLNPKVLVELTPLQRFLMGLCFCPHCLKAAEDAGREGNRLRQTVADFLAEGFSREPTADEILPLDDRCLKEAFEGELMKYLEVRQTVASSLFETVLAVIKSYGSPKIQMGMPPASSAAVRGLPAKTLLASLDRVFESPPHNLKAVLPFLEKTHRSLPEKVAFLPLLQPDYLKDKENAKAFLKAFERGRSEGFAYYNYGLSRLAHMEWLGAGTRS